MLPQCNIAFDHSGNPEQSSLLFRGLIELTQLQAIFRP